MANNIPCVRKTEALHTLVFDWGDTLMVDFGGGRPMAEMPQVAAVSGAAEALAALKENYRLVVATNAEISTPAQVRAALQRVGLDTYITDIFTHRQLDGARKPDLAFFRALEARLDETPQHLAMIGDSYRKDILGANRAGWRTFWYNPDIEACPALTPLHTAEIYALQDLPRAVQGRLLPDWQACLNWLLEQDISTNLLQHTLTVAAASYQLAIWLRAAGLAVDPLLAQRGGMLHDLAKMLSLHSGASSSDHGRLAAQLLIDCEQPELAEIAARHLLFCLMDPQRAPQTWEQKAVYFADKLVEGSQLGALEVRLNALAGRYPHDRARIEQFLPAVMELQDEFCEALGTDPERLLAGLQSALYGERVSFRHSEEEV